MKVRVQKLLQPRSTAPDSRVMEFDFKGLKDFEQ
jgi:hypothetical protein